MKLKTTMLVGASALLVGCMMNYDPTLYDATYTSTKLTKIDPNRGSKVANVALNANEAACKGENGLGLMDTAVEKALAKAPGANYLKNVKWQYSGSCVIVVGEAYKQ